MKSQIHVRLPHQSYDIVSAVGNLDHLGALLTGTKLRSGELGSKVLLVSNPQIFRLYGQRALTSLKQAGFDVANCILPAGERYKTLASVQKIHDAALENRLERSSTLVAIGGGIVGDMTGFAAATWLRGINFMQVPTSLLAMVDAAIGGKTGVNHPSGKNLIGAFHQPRIVVIDSEVLQTLPPREFRAGMAEVIKYGVIWDEDLFHQLEMARNLRQYRYLQPELLRLIIERSCCAKADIVAQDEKETGVRAILNYGHTIGHAIESLTNYRQFNHGEAVALGMLVAGEIAVAAGWWSATETQRQFELIEKTELPTELPADLNVEAIVRALSLDKKVKNGKVRFILPTQIGVAEISDQVPTDLITQSLLKLQTQRATSRRYPHTAELLSA